MPVLVDSTRKALPIMRSRWVVGKGESRGWEKKREGKLGLVCKIKIICNKKFPLHNFRCVKQRVKFIQHKINKIFKSIQYSVIIHNLDRPSIKKHT